MEIGAVTRTSATTPCWKGGKLRTVRRCGWIPVFGHYKPQIEGFPYDPEGDYFTCSAGKRLPFKTFATHAETGLLKVYRADYQDCKQCPLKPNCVPKRWSATAAMPTNYPNGLRSLLS